MRPRVAVSARVATRRIALAVVLVFAAGVAALAGPADGNAITRAKAEAKVLQLLKVKGSDQNVIVFGLGKPLRASQSVTMASASQLGIVRPSRAVKRSLPRLGRKVWMFWADYVPYAHFTHPSELILIDDRTGRVIRQELTGWYPLVDGRRPAFLRSPAAYNNERWQVFRRVDQTSSAPSPATSTRVPASILGPPPTQTLPAGLFDEDCILLVGSHRDPHFAKDFSTMRELGRLVGRAPGQKTIRSWYATASGKKPAAFPPGRHQDDPAPVAGKKGAKSKSKRKGKSVGDVLAEDVMYLNKEGLQRRAESSSRATAFARRVARRCARG